MNPTPTEFQLRMASYFAGEKMESMLFFLLGTFALAASAWLWRGSSAYRGMIVPLALVGLIQVVVGATVYVRTDDQVAQIARRLQADPSSLRADESSRMAKVMSGFRLYKVVEVVILLAGVALALAFSKGQALHAAGIGCILQGGVMLVLDLFAEGRGQDYLDALAKLGG